AAPGARFRNRFVTHRELTRRISRATIEAAALALFLDDLSRPAFRAAHAGRLLLDVFALRIIRASRERPVSPPLERELAAALWTMLFEPDIVRREFDTLLSFASRLTVRITGAGEELPEAPALQYHR